MVGVDVFVHERDGHPEKLAERLNQATEGAGLKLNMISNRGLKVWPNGLPETFCVDHWRCRFVAPEEGTTGALAVIDLPATAGRGGTGAHQDRGPVTRCDGEPAFSPGPGPVMTSGHQRMTSAAARTTDTSTTGRTHP